MRLFAILVSVLLFISCGTGKKTSEVPVLDGKYQLIQLQGEDVSSQGLNFTFDLNEDRVYGETGCNGFSANFLQKGPKLSISQALSTRMYCEGKMELEDRIFKVIERAVSLSEEGRDLMFHSQDGSRLFTLNKIQ